MTINESDTAKYYASKSYWLESCGDDLTPRASVPESLNVDIAIMGAGFTGLWTAYYLSVQNPGLKIALIEKEITGYGASGRNGGWCSPKFPVTPHVAIERYGADMARELQLKMIDTVNEVERVIQEEKLEVDWAKQGSLKVALGDHLLPNLESEMKAYQQLDLGDNYALLDKDQTDSRVKINGVNGSILTKHSAVLHPAKLVGQLAHVLEKRGVKIYEQTEVTELVEGTASQAPQLITKEFTVTANEAVVIAGEAYISQMAKFRRSLIPIYSLIALTEPLSAEQWETIGWAARESVGSNQLCVDYLQKTSDGRILFGLGNSVPYRYASKLKDSDDTYDPSIAWIKQRAVKWFPTLTEDQFTHSWGGPIGVTRDWTPNITFDKRSRVANAWGYAGQGVSTTNLAGQILSELITGEAVNQPLTELPMVQHSSAKWEPEPFRWLGAQYVKSAFNKIDKKSEEQGIAPSGKTLAERLTRH